MQILERPETFSSMLAKQLGAGLGKGISSGTEMAIKLAGTHAKKREKAREQLYSKATSFLGKHAPGYLSPDKFGNLLKASEKYTEQGYLPEEALMQSLQDISSARSKAPTLREEISEPDTSKYINPEVLNFMNKMGSLGKQKEAAKETLSSWREHPKKSLIGLLEGLQRFGEKISGGLPKASLFEKPKETPEEEKARHLGSEISENLAGVFLPLGLPHAKQSIKPSLREFTPPKEAIAPEKVSEPISEAPSLKGRIAEEPSPTATKIRMERLAPESKIHKTGEQTRILHEQLKEHPKYAQEIAADAEKRSARLNRTIGPKALETIEARKALAESELPEAKKAYQKAIERMRALEEEASRSPEMRERSKNLLEAAAKELEESEFFLKQMLNNAKVGEARVGIEEMKRAAQEKMTKIRDMILEGEPVKLAKSDYSPELIARAKQIKSKKPVPVSQHFKDFYTDVHQEYIDSYKNRLSKLEEEIKKPVKSLAETYQKQANAKEAAELRKMIESAESENIIHRHNRGLREIEQRKLVKERLGKAQPAKGEARIEKISKENIRSHMESPEGRAKLAEEVIEQAAKENPKQSEEIRAEKNRVKDVFDDVRKAEEKAKEGAKTKDQPKTAEETKGFFNKRLNDLKELVNAIKKKDLSFFKTRIGKDLTISILSEGIKEVFKELDMEHPGNAAIQGAILGHPKGAAYRALFNFMIRKGINQYKKNNYRTALKEDDMNKAFELRKKYPRSLTKKVEEELLEAG